MEHVAVDQLCTAVADNALFYGTEHATSKVCLRLDFSEERREGFVDEMRDMLSSYAALQVKS
jgi:hypothetical protein